MNMKPYRSINLYQSFIYRKRLFFVVSSLFLSTGLLLAAMFDLIILLALERPDDTTHSGLTTVMVRVLGALVN